MIDPSADLQGKIVLALRAGVPLVAGRVYDEPQSGAMLPYIGIGVTQIVDEGIEDFEGASVFVTLDAWTTGVGRKKQLKDIGRQIITTLDGGSDKLGARARDVVFKNVEYIEDVDGLTGHGVFTFHILTD